MGDNLFLLFEDARFAVIWHNYVFFNFLFCIAAAAAAAAKLLQLCPTLCDPIGGSPPGSPVPGILQAGTLEWVAIAFSNAWKWKNTVKSLNHVWLLATHGVRVINKIVTVSGEKGKWSRSVVSDSSRPHGLQPTRLLRPCDFPGKSTVVGCHCLLHTIIKNYKEITKENKECEELLIESAFSTWI